MQAELPKLLPRAALLIEGSARITEATRLALSRAGLRVAVHPPHGGDLEVEHACADLMQRAENEIGPIGLLVDASAMAEPGSEAQLDPAGRRLLGLSQALARALPEGAEAAVVILLAASNARPGPNDTPSFLSQAAHRVLIRQLALAHAPHIRFNAISAVPAAPADASRRPGTDPSDIAAAILASLRFQSMTGQTIALDRFGAGGYTSRTGAPAANRD